MLLESDIDDEEWLAPSEASPSEQRAGLDADADELVAAEVIEVLNSLGVARPICREDAGLMGARDGWRYCAGEPYHDLAAVGALEHGRVSPAI